MPRHLPLERRELIQKLHAEGRSYGQIETLTGHKYNTVRRLIEGKKLSELVVRHATRTIKCPYCNRSHKHTIRVELFKGVDLRDE
jgi:alkylhydroperoxidase family enzyme